MDEEMKSTINTELHHHRPGFHEICRLDTGDLDTMERLSNMNLSLTKEITALHKLWKIANISASNGEFRSAEMKTIQELIQKKYAILHMIDSMRVELLDQGCD